MPSRATRVLVADDEHSYREALAFRLDKEPGFSVYEATSLQAIAKAERCDVALVGFASATPEQRFTALGQFLSRNRGGAAALLTPHDLAAEYALAVDAGAAGAIDRSWRLDEIIGCIRRLSHHQPLDPPENTIERLVVAQHLASARHAIEFRTMRLTKRERMVLRWMAKGYSGPEVARVLFITEKTERNHVANILAKLEVNSRLQAVLCAIAMGLVDPPTPLDYWDSHEVEDVADVRSASRSSQGSNAPRV